ncbi:MAG: ferrous iron transport protein B [Candidatus Margulisiibacteriota bacterium]
MKKKITVAIVGNPNSGKTSIFNNLVGARQHVGNWPGVTVEKKEGTLIYKGSNILFVDLPGTYSLTAYSQEELVTRNFIIENKPDIVLNIVDGTNIERNLYLTTQLIEMEVPLVIAINMWDEVLQKGIKIDTALLGQLLGIPVIPTSAVKNTGIKELINIINDISHADNYSLAQKLDYQTDLEEELDKLTNVLGQDQYLKDNYPARWLAIKLIEQDQEVYKLVHDRAVWIQIDHTLDAGLRHLNRHFNQSPESIVSESRYAFVNGAIKETVQRPSFSRNTVTDKIDNLLLNRILGLPIFLFILWLVFQLTFSLGQVPMAWIESFFAFLRGFITNIMPETTLTSLLVDGVIAGVGGVLVFLPNIILLFLGIGFLEDSGYMARTAFLVDKIMHRFGLHGRSFIPMILGFGCSVPAIMCCRTLKNRADQLTTMLVIPFMSCGAKLPVYLLIIGAFFPKHLHGNILFGIYIFGIITALLAATLLKHSLFKGLSEPFVMELPPYRMPTLKNLLIRMWEKAWMYLKKAATIILVFSIILWFFSNYPSNPRLPERSPSQLSYSIAGRIGHFIEPAIRPLGFDWKMGIALTSGLAAKEVIVSTLGTIYSMEKEEGSPIPLQEALQNDPHFSPLTALSFLIFTLLYVPCIAATSVFHKESGSWQWTAFYIFFTTTTAYIMSILVYQGGRLLGF